MKKRVFCVLFALLISLLTVAIAENANCCACCSATDCASAASSPSDSEPTARPSRYDIEGFTPKVDQDGFTFFLPSSFEADVDSPDDYRSTYLTSFYPYVTIEFNSVIPLFPDDPHYDDRDQFRHRLEQYALYTPEFEFIQMDESLGLMYYHQSPYGDKPYLVSVDLTNRKNTCNLTVTSNFLGEALELAYAIIDHSVAKEIPLEELAQAG